MQHCCEFKPDDIYYLRDNDIFSSRKLAIGFCPICSKPVAELSQWRFDGKYDRFAASGVRANDLVLKYKDEIVYSLKECNYTRFKTKPFGWKFGINKSSKTGNKEVTRQYACDFYGNKELIKSFQL